jgi:putative heme-binding domain-containing protein
MLGPDLTGARTKGKDFLLKSILEPNAEISARFGTSVIETKEGENLVGIIADQNLSTITLRQRGGPIVWPVLNVQTVQNPSWSLMPDGLEQGLSTQDMADLLDYVMTATQ